MNLGDTIAAISSSPYPSRRIILRASGPDALTLAASLSGDTSAEAGASRTRLTFSDLRVPAWIYRFRGPHSFTGEDSVEFHIPGNPLLAKMLLEELLRRGGRAAEPGEFTARAFFHGKLDLTEAEGVAASISAQSERHLLAARRLLSGELTRRLMPIADSLAETLALIEVEIDFSEEQVTFLPTDEVRSRIDAADAALSRLLAESTRFERIAHEPTIVLAGRPNAGKSSLLNALSGQDRAIVSSQPGTTRDAIWAEVHLPRGTVRITDIAGLEESSASKSAGGEIDRSMQSRAEQAIESADVLLLVTDCTDRRPPPEMNRRPDLTVLTKIDLLGADVPPAAAESIAISSKDGRGLDHLRHRLDQLAFGDDAATSTLALNARHVRAIEECRATLARARQQLTTGPELLAFDLRESLDHLGQITGTISPDDILGKIFSSFCIGK